MSEREDEVGGGGERTMENGSGMGRGQERPDDRTQGAPGIIDAHAHVGRFGSWANVSCTAEELLGKMDAADVERSILFAPDNLLVRRAVRKYPERFVGYVWPNPHDKKALQLVKESVKKWGFRGIKLHPLVNAFLPTDEEVLPIVEFAGKRGYPWPSTLGTLRSRSPGA